MELETLMQEALDHLKEEFYKEKFYFSYSSLNKLLWNPAVFHQIYILKLKEDKPESYLIQGKLIHSLLLEEEKFDDNYIISPASLPTGNLRIVVDTVYRHYNELKQAGEDQRTELNEFSNAILDVMQDINYFQSLKTDDQRIAKIITPEAISYWNFLKQKGSKTLIDQESYDFCKSAVDMIRVDNKLCSLIGCNVTEFDNKEVLNEITIQADIPGRDFGIKGIIDNLVIDHDKRIIYINDIKTTSKDLKDFPETVEFYSYWLQAVIYCTLVSLHYMQLIEQKGYQLKFHFVVIDKMFQTYAYPVSDRTLNAWFDRFKDTIDKAEWHYKNKSFDLPYAFATGTMTL